MCIVRVFYAHLDGTTMTMYIKCMKMSKISLKSCLSYISSQAVKLYPLILNHAKMIKLPELVMFLKFSATCQTQVGMPLKAHSSSHLCSQALYPESTAVRIHNKELKVNDKQERKRKGKI